MDISPIVCKNLPRHTLYNGGNHQKDEGLLVVSKQLTTILSMKLVDILREYPLQGKGCEVQAEKSRGKGTKDQFLQA